MRLVLDHAPEIRRNLEAHAFELHVVGLRQFTSDLPEHRDARGSRIETGELFDWHMIGGHLAGNFLACTEATLLPIVGHRLFANEPCLHELGHAIDLLALGRPARERILAAYRRSIDSGHWKGQYAAKNEHEWFAELTRFYFRPDITRVAFYDGQHARGREWLRSEDAEGFDLVDDIYSGRLEVGPPPRLLPLGAASAEQTLRSQGESNVPAEVFVHNGTTKTIHLVWLDFDGRRDARPEFARYGVALPGGATSVNTFAGHAFVVTDFAGRALCTFTATGEDARVDVRGPC